VLSRATAVWAGILLIAMLNGAARELLITPLTGPSAGHIVSTLLLSGVVMLAAWVSSPWVGPRSAGECLTIGGWWVGLTLTFEFLAGHYLFGKPWPTLLADYNLLQGRIWVLVPLVTLLSPLWAYRRRGGRG
jgi:hypothetical protein